MLYKHVPTNCQTNLAGHTGPQQCLTCKYPDGDKDLKTIRLSILFLVACACVFVCLCCCVVVRLCDCLVVCVVVFMCVFLVLL